jgi:predicted amidohydrolase YtcJ
MPTADLLAEGAVLASGSDYPAADSVDPLVTLYCTVTRKGARGTPDGGWHPAQRLDVKTALRAMTWGAAFAAFQEHDLGTLATGRYADFTVLSADPTATPPDQLRTLKAVMTVVGGHVSYGGSL